MRTTLVVGFVLLTCLGLVLLGVQFVSLRLADSACVNYGDVRGYTSIGYEWSWSEFGTTCTFDGPVRETRLFW